VQASRPCPHRAIKKRSEPDGADRGGVGCLNGADTGSYSCSRAEKAAVNEPQVSKQERFPPVGVGILNTMRGGSACPPPKSALVTQIEDRLIELYAQQDEARRAENRDRARELEIEIDQARAQREEIRG